MVVMAERSTRGGAAGNGRKQRLVDALRTNLRRRKLQQRKREGASGAPAENPGNDVPTEKSTGDIR